MKRHQPSRQWVPPTNDRPRPKFIAQTLGELKSACGRHGQAAVAEARYAAASVWKMNEPDYAGGDALSQAHQYARYRLNMPSCKRGQALPKLALVSPGERSVIIKAAERVLADWEAAGSPGLRANIGRTHQIVMSLRKDQAKRESAVLAVEKIFNGQEVAACPA